MAIYFTPAPVQLPGRVLSNPNRKIALLGSHGASLADCPWNDPSWELWGHSSGHAHYRRQLDCYFDLHPKSVWSRGGKKGARYPQWLAKLTAPIYMQQKYDEIPASKEYPKRRVIQEFSYAHQRHYFTNHVAWMSALAIMEGVSTIGIWGCDYQIESEYINQRACAEYWLGQLDARGVRVILPEQSTLLARPRTLYGYESHDETTGKLLEEYKIRHYKIEKEPVKPGVPGPQLAVPTPDLVQKMEEEEMNSPRPEWALGPLPGTGNGNHKESLNG